MSQSLNTNLSDAHPQVSEAQSTWLWLTLSALLVIAMVFGYLHAGRAFWRVSGLKHESALGSRV